MTIKTKDTAAEYKAGLPRRKSGVKGVLWTLETFSTYVNLLYPHVTVVSGQEWLGNKVKYKLVCSIHGPYEVFACNILKETAGCQCKGCMSDKAASSAGKIRSPRGTKEEKELAAKLLSEGLSCFAISLQLGRSSSTIQSWLKPKYLENTRRTQAKWLSENKERHRSNQIRYQSEFEHGKANANASHATRRLLKTNAPELVFIDNEWCEVDRKETYRIHKDYLLPPSEKKDIQELYLEAQHITEKTGIEHHVDHIQPLSKGGEHSLLNLQIIPASENLSKHNDFRHEDQQLLIQRLFN